MTKKTQAERTSAKALSRFAAVAAVLLTLCLVFMTPVGADAVENCGSGASCTVHKAVAGNTHYSTVEEAFSDSNNKDKIFLLPTVTYSGTQTLSGDIVNIHYNSHSKVSDSPADGGLFYAPYQNIVASAKFLMGDANTPADITLTGSYTGSETSLLSGKLTVQNDAGLYGSDKEHLGWMNYNVNGYYRMGVGDLLVYNTNDNFDVTFAGTNPIAQLDLASGAEMARFGKIYVGSDQHDKGENAYVMNILSGAVLEDFGELTTRGDGTVNLYGTIESYSSKSYQSTNSVNNPLVEHAKDGGHINNNGVINVNGGSIKIDFMNIGRKPSLSTGNAELNVDGGSVEFRNYINVGYDGSARIGEINLINGAELISKESTYTLQYTKGGEGGNSAVEQINLDAGTLTIGVKANGVVNMDASSKISVGTINVGEYGSIVIDAMGYTGSTAKVIEQTAENAVSLDGKVTVKNLPAGYVVSYDNGDVTIVSSVAYVENEVGDRTEYAILADAVAAADGKTVTLMSDVTLTETLTIPKSKKITLDLNGKTLSGIESEAKTTAIIKNNGDLTICDSSNTGTGKITSKALNPDIDWGEEGFPTYANNAIANTGVLTINSGTIECLSPAGGATYVIDNYAGGSLTINGGSLFCANNHAIRMNTATGGENSANSVIINGGDIIGKRAIWIHLAGSDSAVNPIVTLEVNDGVLTSNAVDSSGFYRAIYSCTYGNSFDSTSIIISGGTINGAIALTDSSDAPSSADVEMETVAISDGIFTGDKGVYSYDEDMTQIISGGTFSTDVSAYVADGYASALSGGNYIVKEAGYFNSGISATDVGFDSVKVGYTQPDKQKVTVTNTGNVDVVVLEPTVKNYLVTGFTDGKLSIQAGKTAEFFIQPEAGLPVGNYGIDEVTLETAASSVKDTFKVSFLVYQPSSGGSSTTKPEEPVEPEQPVEPENPTEEPEAGEPSVETEVTDGGEVLFEAPVEPETPGADTPSDEPAEPTVTGVVLPEGTDSEVAFIPVSEKPAPAGKETQTKKVFEINVPKYEKGKPATVKFTMTVAELAADGKTAADVALWHQDEETGEWTKLVTTFVIIDGVVYFEAITFDFSPFAIVYEDVSVPTEPETPEQPTESPAPILAVLAGLGAAIVLRRK